MRNLLSVIFFTHLLCISSVFAQQDSILVEGFENLDGWRTGGQKEISFDLSDKHVKEGQHSMRLHVEIDHEHVGAPEEIKYPMGWPSDGGVLHGARHLHVRNAFHRWGALWLESHGSICPGKPGQRNRVCVVYTGRPAVPATRGEKRA